MRPNCKSIWKSRNTKRHWILLLFKALIVFNSIGIIYGGVVRREIVNKLNSDNSDSGSDVGSSNISSSSSSSSVGHNDDIVINSDSNAIVTKNVAHQSSLRSNVSVTTSNYERSTLSSSNLVGTATEGTTSATATSTTQSPAVIDAATATAAIVTDTPSLSLARITENDIKKPQATLAQNDSKSIADIDGMRIESTTPATSATTTITATATATSTTIPNPTESQQQLRITTIRDSSITEHLQRRKGKTIIHPLNSSIPVESTSTIASLNGNENENVITTTTTTTTIKPAKFDYSTSISVSAGTRNLNYDVNTKTAGESYVGGGGYMVSNSTNNAGSYSTTASRSDSSINSKILVQNQKIETTASPSSGGAEVGSSNSDKIENLQSSKTSSNEVNDIHRNQETEPTEGVQISNQEQQDKDTKISTKLSNSNHSRFNEEQQQSVNANLSDTIVVDMKNFDLKATIDNLQKNSEDSLLLQQTTLPTYDLSFSKHNHDRSEDVTDDNNNENSGNEEITTLSDQIYDLGTGEILKFEQQKQLSNNRTDTENKTLSSNLAAITETETIGSDNIRPAAIVSASVTGQQQQQQQQQQDKNQSKQIINSDRTIEVATTINYDISVNEIKNFSKDSGFVGNFSSSSIGGSRSSSNDNLNKIGVKRDSKFIKGEANMTIPDVAEAWALASMKNVKDIIKNGNLVNNNFAKLNPSNNTINLNVKNLTSEKMKLDRNDTAAKLVVDWSQIVKEEEEEDEQEEEIENTGGSSNNNNLTNSANSIENALESGGIKNNLENKGKLIEQQQQNEREEKTKQTSIITDVKKNNSASSSSSIAAAAAVAEAVEAEEAVSVTPFTPTTKFNVKVEKENNNETLQQINIVPPPYSIIGQDDNDEEKQKQKEKEKEKHKSDIIAAVPEIHKNQVEDLEQQKFNSNKENSKNLNEKEQKNIVIDPITHTTTTKNTHRISQLNLNRSISTDDTDTATITTTTTTKTATGNYLVTTGEEEEEHEQEENIQQVTKTVTEEDISSLSSAGDHLSSTTSSDSSPKKVNNIKTNVTRKGTSTYKEILTTVSSILSTTEAIRSQQTEQNYPTGTYSTYEEDTTVHNNLEPIIKIEPTEYEPSLFSSLPSTDTNLISAATTIRSSRNSLTTPTRSRKYPTTIVPTLPIKSVTKENPNHPAFSKPETDSEPEGGDNTFATGPENSIESNTIDRVPSRTTPSSSDQNSQDGKVASAIDTTTTTTIKINVFPVDTNSVEHNLMHNSTTTHKTVPTKAEQEYSVYNVPKFIDSMTDYPSPTLQHPTTHVPPHLGGPSMHDDSNMPEETDYNVIIAISVSVVGIIALILLVGFLYVMRKRQKQLTYGQRCRPVSLDAYSLDNVSVYNSVRRKGALRASKRSYGNVAFDDPSLKHNVLNVQELAKYIEKKTIIYEEFKDVPQIIARPDEVPAGCEDKNRYANVVPLPETRVILQRQNDDDKTEYINANYVRGPKDQPNYYIACQAPLESTVSDFWRMIWEQNSRVIIMATDLVENGIEKCAEYLPTSIALDNHVTFGDYQITLKSREVKEKYAVSILHLKNTVTNVWREITHFWYKWPETGVPTDEAGIIAMLLEARSSLKASPIDQTDNNNDNSNDNINNDTKNNRDNETINGDNCGDDVSSKKMNGIGNLKNSNETIATNNGGSVEKLTKTSTQKTQGPLTVHCSPGTGRTGTIISCDIVLRSLETPKRSVDIPQIVYYVRRGRASSVQTKEQYEFIYRVANMYASKISGPINDN